MECCSPVAITKSSGVGCWRMSHIHPHNPGIAPVAQRREVAEIELVLLPRHTGGGSGYLAGDESLPARDARSMVEENT